MNRIAYLLAAGVLGAGALTMMPGCETAMRIPPSAVQVGMGTGNTAYRAADPGQIYVYDRTYNKIRYTGYVRRGQMVSVDARNSRILVDNVPVVEQIPLDNNAQFDFYLDRRDRPVVERREVIETHNGYGPTIERRTVTEVHP